MHKTNKSHHQSSLRTKVLEGLKSHICTLFARVFRFLLRRLLLLYRCPFFGQLAKQGVRRGGHKEEDEKPKEQGDGPDEREGGGAAHG